VYIYGGNDRTFSYPLRRQYNMTEHLQLLTLTAASIGFIHTLLGPDHYLPFIVMAKARSWSRVKMLTVTALCGLGHVLSSILLGTVGLWVGIALFRLEAIEAYRGDLAAYALIFSGAAYGLWGLRQAYKKRLHKHLHIHGGGKLHTHTHTHHQEHAHVHTSQKKILTPWVLFTIFVLGPCEPLIPLLIFPAAEESLLSAVWIALVFGMVTIATMLVVVFTASLGIERLPLKPIEQYSHALAGFAICLCGLAVRFGL
jgi:nickel/cobalt exporter